MTTLARVDVCVDNISSEAKRTKCVGYIVDSAHLFDCGSNMVILRDEHHHL